MKQEKRKNISFNLGKQKKRIDKYKYLFLPKDPFKKYPDKTGKCYLIRRLKEIQFVIILSVFLSSI